MLTPVLCRLSKIKKDAHCPVGGGGHRHLFSTSRKRVDLAEIEKGFISEVSQSFIIQFTQT
jgi:hypothetical protein